MADPFTADPLKQAAARAAVAEVQDGMIVGLGTGSTAAHVVRLIGNRVAQGLRIAAVATSRTTAKLASDEGIPLRAPDLLTSIDLCIDGVDEIDPRFRAIKGGGGAMLVEKIIATLARRNIAIADRSKWVDRLGRRAVPVEVLPAAQGLVSAAIATLGGTSDLRMLGDGPFVTDSGNHILDARFADIDDWATLACALSAVPGALGHGLFLTEIDALYLAGPDGVTRHERPTNE